MDDFRTKNGEGSTSTSKGSTELGRIPRQSRLTTAYGSAALLVLNTLLMFLILEGSSAIILFTLDRPQVKSRLAVLTGRENDIFAHYQALPYYAGEPWSTQYWAEHQTVIDKVYSPYVIWRSPPFSGEMVNIDERGLRHFPDSDCQPDEFTIFAFGGSALWGWGAPDDQTIPVHLEKKLSEGIGRPVCVLNFGENGYISTQNLLQLTLLLEGGDIPDMVLFYDGVNDIFAALQAGKPGLHQNLTEIRDQFQRGDPSFVDWLKQTKTMLLLRRIASKFYSPPAAEIAQSPENDQLAEDIIATYLQQAKIVGSLANTYGFAYALIWQPYITLGEKSLTADEKKMINGRWLVNPDASLIDLFDQTYGKFETAAAARPEAHLYSLAGVFDGVEETIWIDTWGHITPVGNEIVAEKLSALLHNEVNVRGNVP